MFTLDSDHNICTQIDILFDSFYTTYFITAENRKRLDPSLIDFYLIPKLK